MDRHTLDLSVIQQSRTYSSIKIEIHVDVGVGVDIYIFFNWIDIVADILLMLVLKFRIVKGLLLSLQQHCSVLL